MTRKIDIGNRGEDLATKFLRKNKYKIIERNYWRKWGEIDIIARAKDKTLVFVEVKTVTGPHPYIEAEEQMTHAKITKLRRTAELYANENEGKLKEDRGWQIDLVAITLDEDGSTDIRHYENV